METCRCGFTGNEDDHPCHGVRYTCKKPATKRLVAYPACLTGAKMKFAAYVTFACDDCWKQFNENK